MVYPPLPPSFLFPFLDSESPPLVTFPMFFFYPKVGRRLFYVPDIFSSVAVRFFGRFSDLPPLCVNVGPFPLFFLRLLPCCPSTFSYQIFLVTSLSLVFAGGPAPSSLFPRLLLLELQVLFPLTLPLSLFFVSPCFAAGRLMILNFFFLPALCLS